MILAAWLQRGCSNLSRCLTGNGTDPSAAPQIVFGACRGTAQQRWPHNVAAGQWQSELNTNYCLATVNCDTCDTDANWFVYNLSADSYTVAEIGVTPN